MTLQITAVPETWFSSPDDHETLHEAVTELIPDEISDNDSTAREAANVLFRKDNGLVLISSSVPLKGLPENARTVTVSTDLADKQGQDVRLDRKSVV